MQDCNYLYALAFTVGGDSGIALVSARSEADAMQVLRNSGQYNGVPFSYVINQIRNIGLTSTIRTELLLESYVNAMGAFDALIREVELLKGDKGDKGDPGEGGVQSDWDETDSSKLSYILNKPEIIATKWGNISGKLQDQEDLKYALDKKQDTIIDLSTIRSGAAAGATAYQKPASGIPMTDLSVEIVEAVESVEDAVRCEPTGVIHPDVNYYDYVIKDDFDELEEEVNGYDEVIWTDQELQANKYQNTSNSRVNTSTNLADATGTYVCYLFVSPGDVIRIYGKGDSTTKQLYVMADSDRYVVENGTPGVALNTRTTPLDITVPEGVARFIVNLKDYDSSTDKVQKKSVSRVEGLVDKVDDLEDEIEGIGNELGKEYITTTVSLKNTMFYPRYGGAIDGSTLKWRGSSYKFILVDVKGAKQVKVTGNASNNTRYVFLKSFTEAVSGVSAVSDFATGYGSISELPTLNANEVKTLDVPDDAIYFYTYVGSASPWNYYPSAMTITTKVSSNNALDARERLEEMRSANVMFAEGMGDLPKTRELDADGYEITQTLQQDILKKRARQLINLKWTPKYTVIGRLATSNTYTANTEVSSPPYGNNDDDWKRIGVEVSLHTFMTAVNNKYSLLYTERVLDGSSKSAWGRTYTSENGGLYYGIMCCGFTAYASGRKYYLNNPYHDEYSKFLGELVPLSAEGEVIPEVLKIGDVANNDGHDFIIYAIKRDENGNITNITYAEANSSANCCHASSRTLAQFKEIILNESHSHADNPFTIYRDLQLQYNYNYEISPYTKGDSSEPTPSPTYNNEICTFAGDKATFTKGSLVVLNYDLDGNTDSSYTKVNVYKDGELYDSITLGDTDYSYNKYVTDHSVSTTPQNVIADMNDHCVVLGDELPDGKYYAVLATEEDDESENPTYWEVVGSAESFAITKTGDDEYKISSSDKYMIKVVFGAKEGTSKGREACHIKLCGWDYYNKSVIIQPKRMLALEGYTVPYTIYLRIAVEGEYGVAPSELIMLQ